VSKRLPVPPELQHLIEKREAARRSGQDRRKAEPARTPALNKQAVSPDEPTEKEAGARKNEGKRRKGTRRAAD